MARYSSRTGPPADQELVSAGAPLNGMSITRQFDAGELLILAWSRISNNAGAAAVYGLQTQLDGVTIGALGPVLNIPNATLGTVHAAFLVPITEGPHTLSLFMGGQIAAGDVAQQNGSRLIVIQLPLWDSDGDVL